MSLVPTLGEVDNSLIFTSLSKNSATLYTYENPQLSSKYSKVNFQEVIDENLAYINGSGNNGSMFGSTMLFKGGSINDLVMLYARDTTDDGDVVTVVTVVDTKVNRTMVFSILNDILVSFGEEGSGNFGSGDGANYYKDGQSSVDRMPGNTSFKLKMSEIIENPKYRNADQYGSVDQANQEIDQVRILMNDNIERVLQRGERIHLLVDKTDKLNNASNSFRRRTVAVRRKLWWGNFKFITIMGLCGIILLYLIGGEFCGLPIYSKCFKNGDGDSK